MSISLDAPVRGGGGVGRQGHAVDSVRARTSLELSSTEGAPEGGYLFFGQVQRYALILR
jgi:hypothetical protein